MSVLPLLKVFLPLQTEKKHKSFQELDRFMHYYTRYKNHEHSYQVGKFILNVTGMFQRSDCDINHSLFILNQLEERLLKTAKEKMEQLSKAFISECKPSMLFLLLYYPHILHWVVF